MDEDDDDADDDGFDVELGDDEEDEDAVAAVVVVEYGVDKELKKLHIYLRDQQYSIWDSYQNMAISFTISINNYFRWTQEFCFCCLLPI